MRKLGHRHRRLAILSYIVLALLLLVFVVPYLIPLGKNHAEIPVEALIGENGRFLDIDGVCLYIEEWTPQSPRETIMFLHGFVGSTFSWRHNISYFARKGYRVISLDMKGFGLSHKDFESDYSHPSQAKLVADVLVNLGIEQVYIVGHSMGSSIMLHFAHLYPEKVIGLISVAGALNLDEGSAHPLALLSLSPFRRASEVFLTHHMTKERVNAILKSAYHNEIVTAEILDGYYNRIVSGHWSQSLLAMTRDRHRNTITFALEDIALPTIIFWGENDTWVRRTDIDVWQARIPAAEFHVIPDAGHLLMEERPELFNNMMLAFLESRSVETIASCANLYNVTAVPQG
jgi:pimeloyl-ACP methyl ester carboxylesterase